MNLSMVRGLLLALLVPALTWAQNVKGAEYFVDADPGEGKAVSLKAADGQFDSSSEGVEFSLDVGALSAGSHVVYVRLQDDQGEWGRPGPVSIYVVAQGEGQIPGIAAAEYFVDVDPGEGRAMPISGSFGGAESELSFTVDTSSLSGGSHVVYVRLQDDQGLWGQPQPARLYVEVAEEGQVPTVAAAEYFVDVDPGEGRATPIAGDWGGTAAELSFSLETASLPAGTHGVYVRLRDDQGQWGRPMGRTVYVEPTSSQLAAPAVVAAEYFIDQDPGEGEATPLTPEDGSFDSAVEAGVVDIPTSGLAGGEHVLYVRFRDENGLWGYPQGQFFQVQEPIDETQVEFRIVAAEYFIDRDPGEGQAIPMQPADGTWGGGFEEAVGQIETAELSVGTHTVSVRMQDQNGRWGRVRAVEFAVEPPPPEKPELVVDQAGPHDFGSLRIDTKGEWTFTVSNASGAEDTLKVRAIEVAAPFAAAITSFELAPGRSQRVTVTFSPSQEGSFAQTLVVRSNDVANPALRIELRGQAVPEQPQMALSAATRDHDFGAVRLGGKGVWSLVVANQGVDSLRVPEVRATEPFAVSPSGFEVAPGKEREVVITFAPSGEGRQMGSLHLRTNDPNQREVDIALTGEGVQFGVPIAEVDTPADEQTGPVGIDFRIIDEDDSAVDLGFAYEVGGRRQAATVGGVTAPLTAAQYKGLTLRVSWDSGADLPGQDEVVRFVVTVSDAEHPAGKEAVTADFRVDNNQPPVAVLTPPGGPVGRMVEIPYGLTDAEGDLLTLVGERSTDGGTTWKPATVVSETRDINRYQSSALWDAFADLGYGRFPVRFRLTPSDRDPGRAGQAELQVVHLVADYDGDQDIDFDDLTLFLVAWNRLPKDAGADIGPATGRVPDLGPVGDGKLDFEDVVALIQMWNWSAGVYPPAKLADGRLGAEALALGAAAVGDQVGLAVQLIDGALLAAGLELNYDAAAWELVGIEPGEVFAQPADLLLLKRETGPGRLVVQLGSLGGTATRGGALLRFILAPLGRGGGEDVRLRYDLRDGEGQRYAAGSLVQRVRLVPEQCFLSANLPNPFNPGTQIPYGLAEEAVVELSVYDILGRQVVQLVPSTRQQGGYYRVSWDGCDQTGRPVGSGVYLYRLVVRPAGGGEPQAHIRRMLLLR